MTFPAYLILGFALKIDCVKYAGYRKVTFNKQIITHEYFLNYMLCMRTLSSVFFNSNCKRNVIRQMLECKSKHFF